MARQVERALLVDDEGRVVVVERETTGVMVENEEGQAVAVVQTAVRGLVLQGNRQQQPATGDDDDDDGPISCCAMVLGCLLGIVCLPCLLVYGCFSCCCKDEDD